MSEFQGDELIDVDDLVEITKISKVTWARRRMRNEGPPYIAIGRAIRYPRSKTLEWLAEESAKQRGRLSG